jgi:hypothetical protein
MTEPAETGQAYYISKTSERSEQGYVFISKTSERSEQDHIYIISRRWSPVQPASNGCSKGVCRTEKVRRRKHRMRNQATSRRVPFFRKSANCSGGRGLLR